MNNLLKCLAMVLASFAISHGANAAIYSESGDAGFTLGTAQTVNNGTTAISGRLGGADSVDVFRFSWGGGNLQVDTQGTVTFDSMLFIFDLGGNLLAFNDDFPTCCQSLTSANLAAGDYLVAIDQFPFNINGNLAGFANNQTVFRGNNGAYTINLSAAVNGNAVPEPGSLALFGLAALALGATRRRKVA